MSALQEPQGVSSRAATLQVALFAAASVDIDWTPMTGLALVSHVCSHVSHVCSHASSRVSHVCSHVSDYVSHVCSHVSSHVSHVCSHVTPHSPAHTTMHV